MAITFSGVGSGLPVSDWVTQLMAVERQPTDKLIANQSKLQNSKLTLNTLEGKFSSLRSTIEKFTDGNITSSMDLFKKMLSSTTNNTMATATATNIAVPQTIKLKIDNLATSTKAQSVSSVANNADATTKITSLANGSGTVGKFSMYINGKKEEFTLADGATLGDAKTLINDRYSAANGYTDGLVVADITPEGKFQINVDESQVNSFNLGSSSDTSNFFNVTQLSVSQINTGTADAPVWKPDKAESANPISSVNTQGKLVSNEANLKNTVTTGTFKIGKAEFTVDENSTISSIVNKINSDSTSGVTAQFDPRANKLSLTSKTPGKTTINLEKGTSGFLESMGLLDSSGNVVDNSQTLGSNAKVYINDATDPVEVNSNTLSSDVSGIPGVTINLLKITKDTDKGTDFVNINISRDNDQIVKAVNDYLSKYNEINSEIDKQTATGADLANESALQRIKSDLRFTFSKSVAGLSKYNSASSIGISTGSVGTSVKADVKTFSLDETKLRDALANNPDQVRALLLGDSSKGVTGLFQSLKDKVANTLDPTAGYFKSKKDSMSSSIKSLTDTIAQQEDRLTKKKETLTAQYNAMDQAIAQMKSQGNAMSAMGL